MSKQVIHSPDAPEPIGPYSQGIKSGNLLFVSGQVALKPGSVNLVNEDIIQETHQVMKNVLSILLAGGMDFSNVVKTTIFLSDMDLFGQVNLVYAEYFNDNFPARETVAVKGLPKNAHVEISVIAAV